MAKRILVVSSAAALAVIAGCIVSDQLSTLTIRPDGSADWVRFQSNIRSTEEGAKGVLELKQFVEEFDAHRDDDHRRLVQAGGEVVEARWLLRQEPYANLLVARLPRAAALEEFCTIRGEKGEVVARARFAPDGRRRRFSIAIPVPKDEKPGEPAKRTLAEWRQEQASGISETRVVVAGGRIVGSRGFTVAADRRSALLEPAEVQELMRSGKESVELYLEWELTGN